LHAVVDHLIAGCRDLEAGIAGIAAGTGVRAVLGGVHPGRGTRNALLSLGTRRYLEIVAPDPLQSTIEQFGVIRELAEPRLIGWAAGAGHIDALARRLRQAEIACVGPTPGSRTRPDGTVLEWRTVVLTDDAGGLLPFFIEWSAHSVHPSIDAPTGCALARFDVMYPDVDQWTRTANTMGIDLPVARADHPRLRATITGPRGAVEL
jgi:hypothetical protein